MLLSVIAVSVAGLLLGLRFKAPALIAATFLLLAVTLSWNGLGLSPVTMFHFLIMAVALAFSYLVGLFISARIPRDQ